MFISGVFTARKFYSYYENRFIENFDFSKWTIGFASRFPSHNSTYWLCSIHNSEICARFPIQSLFVKGGSIEVNARWTMDQWGRSVRGKELFGCCRCYAASVQVASKHRPTTLRTCARTWTVCDRITFGRGEGVTAMHSAVDGVYRPWPRGERRNDWRPLFHPPFRNVGLLSTPK